MPVTDEIIGKDCGCDAETGQTADLICDTPTFIKYPQRQKLDLRASITIPSTWNIPQCRDTVVVTIPKLSNVPLGAYVWSSQFGLFQIIKRIQDDVVLLNPCVPGNAVVGTFVPENSSFILSISPTLALDSDISFLANDLVAPPLGQCTSVRLTSLEGISPGMQIQIGDVSYWATEDLGGSLLRICENGDGALPGTLLVAKNAFGQYQVPVTPHSSSLVLTKTISGGPAVLSDAASNAYLVAPVYFRNPYINKAMTVKYSIAGRFQADAITTDNTQPINYSAKLFSQFDALDSTQVVYQKKHIHIPNNSPRPQSLEVSWSGVTVIPALTDTILYGALQLEWTGPDEADAGQLNISEFSVTTSVMGVLV